MSKKKTNHILAVRTVDTGEILAYNKRTKRHVWAGNLRKAVEVLERSPELHVYNGSLDNTLCATVCPIINWVVKPNPKFFRKVVVG